MHSILCLRLYISYAHMLYLCLHHESPARRTKNNPVLIGEPGVGKTAIGKLLLCYFSYKIVMQRFSYFCINTSI